EPHGFLGVVAAGARPDEDPVPHRLHHGPVEAHLLRKGQGGGLARAAGHHQAVAAAFHQAPRQFGGPAVVYLQVRVKGRHHGGDHPAVVLAGHRFPHSPSPRVNPKPRCRARTARSRCSPSTRHDMVMWESTDSRISTSAASSASTTRAMTPGMPRMPVPMTVTLTQPPRTVTSNPRSVRIRRASPATSSLTTKALRSGETLIMSTLMPASARERKIFNSLRTGPPAPSGVATLNSARPGVWATPVTTRPSRSSHRRSACQAWVIRV